MQARHRLGPSVGFPLQRIADRLETTGRGSFVGREAELELFRSALRAEVPPFAVLHIHGPGGVGKTTLLRELARVAAADRAVCRLDARNIELSPPGFLRALRDAVGWEAGTAPDVTAQWPPRGVLLLDTYEMLAPLDTWLREIFLPQLPALSLVVIAGRNPPAPEWRIDPDWADLTRIVQLHNLPPEASRAYLSARRVPAHQQADLLVLTRGHPLALALLADVLAGMDPEAPFRLEQQPDAVHMLLQRLVEQAPSAEHRRALAVCAIARTTTEAMLVEVLGDEAGTRCFDWLRGLSFVEHGPYGVFPHELVRDLLDADLRWRNPESYRDLHQRVLTHLQDRFARASAPDLLRMRLDILFVHRHDPGMQPFFAWDAFGHVYAEPATAADAPAILDMVRRHQGPASAAIAEHWLRRQPEGFKVFRTMDAAVCGFMANVELHRAAPEDFDIDPALAAAQAFMQRHGPPRSGEEVVHLRFWMHRDAYQAVSPAVNLTAANSVVHWLTHPGLSWNFITMADPEYWKPHFQSINMRRAPDADFEVDGHRFGIFAHDWRMEPAAAWQMRRRATVGQIQGSGSGAETAPARLSWDAFEAAVRQALRDFTRPVQLAGNPLMRTSLSADPQTGEASPAVLQALLRDAAASLDANPRDRKLYLAVWHTYFQPAPTQERAAEQLRLPFSTYRYHLGKGIDHIVAALWQRYGGDL